MADTPASFEYDRQIIFDSGEGFLHLRLESPWVRSVGPDPDINVALAPGDEVEAFKSLRNVKGNVYFYFSDSSNAQEDFRQANVQIIGVEPSRWAEDENFELGVRVVEYRVAFADVRYHYQWPRGGYLTPGEINKEPIGSNGRDANGSVLESAGDLALRCIKAMGISPGIIPNSLNSSSVTFRNLNWRGTHAPTELTKILTEAAHFLYINQDGFPQIAATGSGSEPAVDYARRVYSGGFSSFDRRPEVVVFTSAPNGSLSTATIGGIGEDGWQFVCRDQDGQFKPLSDTTWFQSEDALTALKNGFKNVPEESREQVRKEVYHCIRLNPDRRGPSPIQLRTIESGGGSSGSQYHLPTVLAKTFLVATTNGYFGNYADTTVPIRCTVEAILDHGKVIQVSELLCTIGSTTPLTNWVNTVKPLSSSDDLKVRCTREVFIVGSDGRWNPQFFEAGMVQTGGGPEFLSSDDISNYLNNPDSIIIRKPELRTIFVDGEPINLADLNQRVSAMAPLYLRPQSQLQSRVLATGYWAQELGGRVNKVSYDQQKLMTTIEVDGHFQVTSEYSKAALEAQKLGAGGQYPQQAATAGLRTADGSAGNTQPAVIGTPSPNLQAADVNVKVKITDLGEGGGKYVGVIVGGDSTASDDDDTVETGWLQEPEGMEPGTNQIQIMNLFEDKAFTDHGSPSPLMKQILPVGSYHLGRIVHTASNGTSVEIESCLCGTTVGRPIGQTNTVNISPDPDFISKIVDRQNVTFTMLTRVAFQSGGTAIVGLFRDLLFECGVLKSISGETAAVIVPVATCT